MNLTRTSCFLSLILRHKPETIGISLDEHGWANVDELISGSPTYPRPTTQILILCIIILFNNLSNVNFFVKI